MCHEWKTKTSSKLVGKCEGSRLEVPVYCCAGCGDTAGRAAGVWPTRRSGSFRRPGLPAERQQEPGPECIVCAADVFAPVFRHPPDSESFAVV